VYWICVSVNPYYLQSRDIAELDDLFAEIFGDDYIEHYLVDYDEYEKNHEIDRYAFVHCREYKKHAQELKYNRYIKNVLSDFNNIVEIPPEEIFETKISVPNIIDDGYYCVNRTGFFLFGDIVRVLRGSLSSMNGIIIKRCKDNPDFYIVYFRLFVNTIYKRIHISNLVFDTSIFKFIKVPIKRGNITEATKRIKKTIKEYNKLQKENDQKRLIDEMDNKRSVIEEDEVDVANIISKRMKNSEKKGRRKRKK